jgi:hypothetical protein
MDHDSDRENYDKSYLMRGTIREDIPACQDNLRLRRRPTHGKPGLWAGSPMFDQMEDH